MATFLVELLGRLGEVHWTTTAEQALDGRRRRATGTSSSPTSTCPGMNGLEFIARGQGRAAAGRDAVLSGHSSFDHAVAALRAGADDYLTKPSTPPALLEKARGADRRHARAAGEGPGDRARGRRASRRRRDRRRRDPAAPRRAGPPGHGPDAHRRRGGRRRARTARRSPRSAAELMSARLVHADLEDTSVSEGGSTIATIKRVVEDIRPDARSTRTRSATSTRTTATCTTRRSSPPAASRACSATRRRPRPSTSTRRGSSPIDEYLERKIEVIQAYTSQVKVRALPRRGAAALDRALLEPLRQARYVEPLEIVRDSDAAAAAPAARGAGSTCRPRRGADVR